MRHLLVFECGNRRDRGIGGVTIVSATAPVELAVLVFGRPRPQVFAPAGKLGLLV